MARRKQPEAGISPNPKAATKPKQASKPKSSTKTTQKPRKPVKAEAAPKREPKVKAAAFVKAEEIGADAPKRTRREIALEALASRGPDQLGGAPTAYKPEYARIARVMCKNGATDADLADAFEVNTSTIWRWQSTHDEFCKALKVQKGEYDDRVERAFAQRALGYSYDAVKIFMPSGATEPVYAAYREHVPPDPGAAKAWLASRKQDEWATKDINVNHGVQDSLASFLSMFDGQMPRIPSLGIDG